MKNKNQKNCKTTPGHPDPKKDGQKISLCMIVKDEEKFLPRCLESAKDVADEIIVVDTGSTDKTVEIAKSYGAMVYHHPWENNFSKHRNQSLSYATGDWILIMDADEELDKETSPMVREVIKGAPAAVVNFNVRSYLQNKTYLSEGSSPRLFKKGLGIHYQGYVHNQIVHKEKVTSSSIVLWHYGYDLDDEEMKAKKASSLELLRKQKDQFPDSITTRHHLAVTLMACKKWEEAYNEAEKVLEMRTKQNVNDPFFSWTYYICVNSLMNLDRHEEAEIMCMKGIRDFDWSIDLYHCLTNINFLKTQYNDVIKYGSEYFRLRDKLKTDISAFPTFQFETVHRDWIVHRAMGYACLYLGRKAEGLEYLDMVLCRIPECDRLTLTNEIGRNILKIGETERGSSLLQKLPHNETVFKKGLLDLGNNYERENALDEAVTLYDQIEGTFDEDAEIPFKRGLLLLKLKRHDEAALAFEKAVKRNPEYVEALVNWGLALENLGEKELVEKKYLSALEINPDSPKGNLNLGIFYFKDKDYLGSKDYLLKASPYFHENIYLQLALARSYIEAEEIEAMIAVCENILRLLDLPADILIESMSQVAELFVGISEKLLREKKLDSFDIALDIAKHLSPESTVGLKRLSRLAFDISEWERGADILETALAVDPKDSEILSLVQGHIKGLEAQPG